MTFTLSAALNARAGAIFSNGTLAATRRLRRASVLTVGNKQIVDDEPIFLWQKLPKGKFCFSGVFRFHISPAVRYSVNMSIHTDARFSKTERHNQIRRFSPHARQL